MIGRVEEEEERLKGRRGGKGRDEGDGKLKGRRPDFVTYEGRKGEDEM